jgi:hypothetical protein
MPVHYAAGAEWEETITRKTPEDEPTRIRPTGYAIPAPVQTDLFYE